MVAQFFPATVVFSASFPISLTEGEDEVRHLRVEGPFRQEIKEKPMKRFAIALHF